MPHLSRTVRTAAAAVVFALALAVVWGLTVYRYESDPAVDGSFQDFRDAGYYAAQALVDGNNPYDVELYLATYPVGQEFPLLPPTYAALHIPLLLFDLVPAAVIFLILSIAAIVAVSAWSLYVAGFPGSAAAVLLVSAAVLVSNGGRITLIFGQATVVWVAAVYVAVTAAGGRDRLGVGGLALAITKPTFGLAAAAMLAGWGRWVLVVLGSVVAAAVSLFLVIPIISWAGGLSPFVDTMADNWEFSRGDLGASLETTMARVDVASTIRQFTGWAAPSLVELVIAAVVIGGSALLLAAVRRTRPRSDAVVVLVCLATLAGVYHLHYDLLLLLLPTLLVLKPSFAGGLRKPLRVTLLAALLVANFNVFHSLTFADRVSEGVGRALGPGLTGAAVVVALGCAVAAVLASASHHAYAQ